MFPALFSCVPGLNSVLTHGRDISGVVRSLLDLVGAACGENGINR